MGLTNLKLTSTSHLSRATRRPTSVPLMSLKTSQVKMSRLTTNFHLLSPNPSWSLQMSKRASWVKPSLTSNSTSTSSCPRTSHLRIKPRCCPPKWTTWSTPSSCRTICSWSKQCNLKNHKTYQLMELISITSLFNHRIETTLCSQNPLLPLKFSSRYPQRTASRRSTRSRRNRSKSRLYRSRCGRYSITAKMLVRSDMLVFRVRTRGWTPLDLGILLITRLVRRKVSKASLRHCSKKLSYSPQCKQYSSTLRTNDRVRAR